MLRFSFYRAESDARVQSKAFYRRWPGAVKLGCLCLVLSHADPLYNIYSMSVPRPLYPSPICTQEATKTCLGGGVQPISGGGGIFKSAAVRVLQLERKLMTTGDITKCVTCTTTYMRAVSTLSV
eukprot:1160934-Pelagomonas_calceolata.AAC.3